MSVRDMLMIHSACLFQILISLITVIGKCSMSHLEAGTLARNRPSTPLNQRFTINIAILNTPPGDYEKHAFSTIFNNNNWNVLLLVK